MTITHLPPEILGIICEHLWRNDLRNLRLTCHGLKSAPARILFRIISLKFDLRSFESLANIAHHPIFSRYVESIAYNGCSIGDCALSEGFDEWLRCNAGKGFGLDEEERDIFLQRFTRSELEGFYGNYVVYVMGQREVMETEKSRIFDAMTRLPRVRELCAYAVQSPGITSHEIKSNWIRSSSLTAQRILEEPDNIWGYNLRPQQFWNLLNAAHLLCLGPQLRSLHGTNLDWRRWNEQAMVASTNIMNNLSQLQELTLGFDVDYALRSQTGELCRWLLHVPEIQKLDLRFSTVAPLQIHLSPEHFWGNLRELSLSGFRTRRDFFQKILLRHKDTLCILHLSNMEFEDSVFNWPPNESWMSSVSSWLRLFRLLRARMNLQSAEFAGLPLCTVFVQIHNFFGGNQSQMDSADNRGCAIERFVTGQGYDPFEDLDLEPDTQDEIP